MRFYSCSALFMALAFTISGHAALQNLTQEEREAGAAYILEGEVTKVVETIRKKYEGWSDYVYTVEMDVSQAIKAEYPPPATFTFTFWKVAERPEGLTGDWGQHTNESKGLAIHAGKRVRVYTSKTDEGGQKLLKPNGFDVLPKIEPSYLLAIP